jgi:WD40 repeat protein
VWDAATGRLMSGPLRHKEMVWAVAFSPDSQMVLTGSEDGTARLWDASTGMPVGPQLWHRKAVQAVAFSPVGDCVLTGSEDGTAGLWDVFSPLRGEVKRLVLWAQVLTGMELDDTGSLRVFDAPTWHQRLRELNELGGPRSP